MLGLIQETLQARCTASLLNALRAAIRVASESDGMVPRHLSQGSWYMIDHPILSNKWRYRTVNRMASISFPHNLTSAKEALKKFSRMAYSVEHLEKFQRAISIVYGAEYIVETDCLGRIIFCCKICHKSMNNEAALAEHSRSDFHHKNLDKKMQDKGFKVKACFNFPSTSLHFKLANSILKPLGLQMIEEYTQGCGPSYYKCILCAAHGKIDPMYHHVIGKNHTEKYIRWRCFLKDSSLTSAEREEIRQKFIIEEGVDYTQIKVIKGKTYFPHKWKAQGRPAQRPKAEYFPE
ncbi:uncharacterized protein LOC119589805 isoform X2 [Penaeus monodon]|uniref:uncharacterized protein LOC119589805 isoform X2 n=1 Tax=Penaeus monodon TaxID=6687 RepID=UPI0018A7A6C5|nr:uncharacterized protein LOC119589805 isoform X2 [Penaeus monodon]